MSQPYSFPATKLDLQGSVLHAIAQKLRLSVALGERIMPLAVDSNRIHLEDRGN